MKRILEKLKKRLTEYQTARSMLHNRNDILIADSHIKELKNNIEFIESEMSSVEKYIKEQIASFESCRYTDDWSSDCGAKIQALEDILEKIKGA